MNIQKINTYILDCIDHDAYGFECDNDKEKLQFLYDTFISEYWYPQNVQRYNNNKTLGFQNWISGLPTVFTVDFSNFDIWNKAIELGLLKQDPTDKQIDSFLPKWFHIIAFRTFVLMRKNGVNTNA